MRKNNFLVAVGIILFLIVLGYIAVTFYFETQVGNGGDGTLETTVTDSETESSLTETEPPIVYDYLTDVNEEIVMTGKDERYLLLVNKQYPLGEEYEPADRALFLRDHAYFKYFTKEEELESRTAAAVLEMMDEMYACGIRDVLITSAYRSYARQKDLFNGYVQKEMACETGFSADAIACLGNLYIQENYIAKGKDKLSYEDARKVALSYSAEPGKSEHQTGLCVDFITEDMNGRLTTVFENKVAFEWLSENAYKFGFILRYPKGKEDITGYTYEPWHYRFVGREAATEIHFDNLTLEEYLGVAQ